MLRHRPSHALFLLIGLGLTARPVRAGDRVLTGEKSATSEPAPDRVSRLLVGMPALDSVEGLDELRVSALVDDRPEAWSLAAIAAIDKLPPEQAAALRTGLKLRISEPTVYRIEKAMKSARERSGDNKALRDSIAALEETVQPGLRASGVDGLLAHLDALYAERAGDASLDGLRLLRARFVADGQLAQDKEVRAFAQTFVETAERLHPQSLRRTQAEADMAAHAIVPALLQPIALLTRNTAWTPETAIEKLVQPILHSVYLESPEMKESVVLEVLQLGKVRQSLRTLLDRVNAHFNQLELNGESKELSHHAPSKEDPDLKDALARMTWATTSRLPVGSERLTGLVDDLVAQAKIVNLQAATEQVYDNKQPPKYMELRASVSRLDGDERDEAKEKLEKIVSKADEDSTVSLHWRIERDLLRIVVDSSERFHEKISTDVIAALRESLREAAIPHARIGIEKLVHGTVLWLELPVISADSSRRLAAQSAAAPVERRTTEADSAPTVIDESAIPVVVGAGSEGAVDIVSLTASAVALTAPQQELLDLALKAKEGDNARRLLDMLRLSAEDATPQLEQAMRADLVAFLRESQAASDAAQFNAQFKDGQAPPYVDYLFSAYETLAQKHPTLASQGAVEILKQGWVEAQFHRDHRDELLKWTTGRLYRFTEAIKPHITGDPGAFLAIAESFGRIEKNYDQKYVKADLGIGGYVGAWVGLSLAAHAVYGIITWMSTWPYYSYQLYESEYLRHGTAPIYHFMSNFYWPWFFFIAPIVMGLICWLAWWATASTIKPFAKDLGKWRRFYEGLIGGMHFAPDPMMAQLSMSKLAAKEKGRWSLTNPNYSDAFHRLAEIGAAGPTLPEGWGDEVLPIVADIDPKAFLDLVTHAGTNPIDAMRAALHHGDNGLWSLKRAEYGPLLRDLLKGSPDSEIFDLTLSGEALELTADLAAEAKIAPMLLRSVKAAGDGWTLADATLDEGFRRWALRALNNEALLHSWRGDVLAALADADADVFAALAPQFSDEQATGAAQLVVKDVGGRWTLKNRTYRETFEELAVRAQADKILPIAADVDKEAFVEAAKRLPPAKVREFLSHHPRQDLLDALKAGWPEFEPAAGETTPSTS